MTSIPLIRFAVVAGALLAATAARGAEPTADGLYAGFTTSRGEFWCRLEFEKAPRTVANFVGLAEGTRPWLDFQQPALRQTPFYDGITFHRVINGFMNQSGSRNGKGTDDPGYRFMDEFHPDLRHNRPGILSMANSGPHSNGSQFFVTVAATPWLDNLHSVFGEVVQGYDVVTNINLGVGTPGGVPRETVALQKVRILRVGEAARAFNPATVTPPLPAWAGVESRLRYANRQLLLDYPAQPKHEYHVLLGPDLVQWMVQSFPSDVLLPLTATGLMADWPQFYFHIYGVETEP